MNLLDLASIMMETAHARRRTSCNPGFAAATAHDRAVRSGAWVLGMALVALVVLVALTAGCGSGGSCRTDGYPDAPVGATSLVHVSAGCSDANADGSAERPYGTLTKAIAAASDGAALLVVPGTYAENVVVDKSVSIVGSPYTTSCDEASIIVQAPDPYAILVTGGVNATLRGVHVESADSIGVWVTDGAVTLDASCVEGTQQNSQGQYGYGILAAAPDGSASASSIIVQNSAITGSALVGILASGETAGGIIVQSTISGNGINSDGSGAGIWLQNSAGGASSSHVVTPPANCNGAPVQPTAGGANVFQIMGNTISRNGHVGIGHAGGAGSIIVQNNVTGTVDEEVFQGLIMVSVGDGVSITESSWAQVQCNTIQANGRMGVIADSFAAGTSIDNNMISGNDIYGIIVQNGGANVLDPNMNTFSGASPAYKILGASDTPYVVATTQFSQ